MSRETNSDGLTVHYGPRASDEFGYVRAPRTAGNTQEVTMHIVGTELTTDEDGFWGGSTPDLGNAGIPAGSHIVKATLVVDEVFTSGGSATLTIGTYKSDGAAIDADGIDATIAITAIDAIGDVIACNGAQINSVVLNTAPTGSVNAGVYLSAKYATAAFTAGKARIVVEYVQGA